MTLNKIYLFYTDYQYPEHKKYSLLILLNLNQRLGENQCNNLILILHVHVLVTVFKT